MIDGEGGNGRDGTNPAWPPLPLCDPEALEDPRVAAGVLKRVIANQDDDARWIERVDTGVINLQKSIDELSARSKEWQEKASAHLGAIDARLRMLTNQVFVVQMLKVGGPTLMAFLVGGYVAVSLWLMTHH